MKKLLILIAAVAISLGTASAQKPEKKDRATKKAEAIAENMQLVQVAFMTGNLTFVPYEVYTPTSKRYSINNYESMRLTPDYISINFSYIASVRPSGNASSRPGITQLTLNTHLFEIKKREATQNGYMMVIQVNGNDQIYTLTLNTNSKNNVSTLVIDSTNESEVMYNGIVRTN